MFENYKDWAISRKAPLKWRIFNDYLVKRVGSSDPKWRASLVRDEDIV